MDQAEDIMQEAFIKLWDNCANVQFESVKGYLFTTAHNLFLNTVKHEKVKRAYQKHIVKDRNSVTPEFLMMENEFMDKIEAAIADLNPKQREVFLLNRIERKKYREIAVTLNISVKAVEKRMHQALVIMRNKIGDV